jgi:hypothetical protein
MNVRARMIEVDEATAEALEARAAERGVSVSDLLAGLAALEEPLPEDTEALRATGEEAQSPDAIQELDRRWAAIQAGEPTVAHDEVVRWLETWGTPAFRPWADR